MPSKKKTVRKKKTTARSTQQAEARPIVGIIFILFAVFALVSLIDYDPVRVNSTDQGAVTGNGPANEGLTGAAGDLLASNAFNYFGEASLLIPLYALWAAYMACMRHMTKLTVAKGVAMLVGLVGAASLLSFVNSLNVVPEDLFDANKYSSEDIGGVFGQFVYKGTLEPFFGVFGAFLIVAAIFIGSMIALFGDNIARITFIRKQIEAVKAGNAEKRAAKEAAKAEAVKAKEEAAKAKAEAAREKERQRKAKEAEKKKNAEEKKAKDAEAAKSAKPEPEPKLVKPKKGFGKKAGTEDEEPAPVKPAGEDSTAKLKKRFAKPTVKKGDEAQAAPKPEKPAAKKPEREAPAEPERYPSFGEVTDDDVEPPVDEEPIDFAALRKQGPGKKAASSESGQGERKSSISFSQPKAEGDRSGGGGAPEDLKIVTSDRVEKASRASLPSFKGDYQFPSLDLLIDPETMAPDDDQPAQDHAATADALVRTLEEFNVKVTMGEVHQGPVITRYDIHPAAGVRVEKIQNLDKNIALALKATSIRILAPVPGKGCVGIEVPNKVPQAVCIREILESRVWVESKAEIPIALGKEVSGKPLMADLTKMPHLLIAGSTGAGKTVCINAVIASLVYHSSPEDLRFVMVDPKIVEMQVYNDLPHMLIPVVTDPKKVPAALKHLINEMERRYQLFASIGVRNIAGYNAKMAKKRDADAEKLVAASEAELTPEERAAINQIEVPRDQQLEEMPEKIPYIVCIIDELADLMMVAPADVETGIARLAQLARAAGIHLIIATQRPSVNVITGVIKANLPSRIAFKVASKVDSRTILDGMGAEHLIGRGDMLFLPPGSADLIRSQGAFVSDDEINGIVERLKENGPPQFDEAFQKTIELGEAEGDGEGSGDSDYDDELVPDAIEVIKTSKRASTSMLQRRLKIGYNRAARIMEILEDEGIVGPENGSSPREILFDFDS